MTRQLHVMTDASAGATTALGATLVDAAGMEIATLGTRAPDVTDSNAAEMEAAAAGVQLALDHGAQVLTLWLDSLTTQRHLLGQLQVQRPDYGRPLFVVRRLARRLRQFRVYHVTPEQNWRADALAGAAVQGRALLMLPPVPLLDFTGRWRTRYEWLMAGGAPRAVMRRA